MSCSYNFVPGPESCVLPTVNLTLGRSIIEADLGEILVRTSNPTPFDPNLSSTQIIITWLDSNNNTFESQDPSTIASTIEKVNVQFVNDSGTLFDETYIQTAFYDTINQELTWTTNGATQFRTSLNNNLTFPFKIPLVTDGPSGINPNDFPDYLPYGTFSVIGLEGLPTDASAIRTGPLGALSYAINEQNPAINSNGEYVQSNRLMLLNLNSCEWEELVLP